MKDDQDRKTLPLPLNKQAAYSIRQRAAGRVQSSFWMTKEERAAVVALLAKLRGETDTAQQQ